MKVRPDDQLNISPEDLEKEVPPRVLYPLNPRAAHNTTQYSFKEKCFKVDEQVDQVVMHFAMDGLILLKESPEAIDQIEVLEKKEAEQNEKEEAEAIDEDFDPPENEKEIPVKNPCAINSTSVSAQPNPRTAILRERSWTTEPPPTTRNFGTVTQWEIFDQYMADIEAAKEKEKDDKKGSKSAYDDMSEKKKKSDSDPTYSENMKLSIKIMERMVNQNAENEVYHDFKYWKIAAMSFEMEKGHCCHFGASPRRRPRRRWSHASSGILTIVIYVLSVLDPMTSCDRAPVSFAATL